MNGRGVKIVVLLSAIFYITGCISKRQKEYNNPNIEWLTPSEQSCYLNGGEYRKLGYHLIDCRERYKNEPTINQCFDKFLTKSEKVCSELTFQESQMICQEMGRRLPKLKELQKIAKECGSDNYNKKTGKWKNTKSNKLYMECVENKRIKKFC